MIMLHIPTGYSISAANLEISHELLNQAILCLFPCLPQNKILLGSFNMSKLGSVVLETSHEAFLTVNTGLPLKEPSGGKRETSSKQLENPCPHSFGSNCTTAETTLLLQSNRPEFCFFLPDFVIAYDETDCYSFLPYLHLSKVNKISWFHRIE
ncbi:hypothetical protein YC2023_042909 [Brassica napus]